LSGYQQERRATLGQSDLRQPRPGSRSIRAPARSSQVLLNEVWGEVDVKLHEGRFARVLEAVNLPPLDHEDVSSPGFEFLTIDDPRPMAFLNELHFVVRVAMGSGPGARSSAE